LEWEFATTNHQEDMSRLIAPGQLYESFSQDMYQVLKETLSPDPTGITGMGIVSDCQLELKAWIWDVFTIAGERMTFALTLSCLFNAKP